MDRLDFFNLFEEFCHKFLLNGTNITSVFQDYKHNEIKKINLVFVVTLGCFLILPCVKRSIHWHGNIFQLFTESLSWFISLSLLQNFQNLFTVSA